MKAKEKSRGGVRPGAGRPVGAKNKIKKESKARAQHQVRAYEDEWLLIKRFTALVKVNDLETVGKLLNSLEK